MINTYMQLAVDSSCSAACLAMLKSPQTKETSVSL